MSSVTLPGATAPIGNSGAHGGAPHAAPHGAKHGHAATAAAPAKQSFLGGNAEMFLAAGVVAVVALLVMPLPPFLLDALLALSFALSIVILLVTMSTRDPLEFSIFPSLLLLVTLLRLGLNVSTTRLILSTGHAGQVIAAFGNFAAYWLVGLHVAETVGNGIIDKDAVTPAVVFGARATQLAIAGDEAASALYLLAAIGALSLTLAPLAAAAAVRISLE